jgi:hypothetical protein
VEGRCFAYTQCKPSPLVAQVTLRDTAVPAPGFLPPGVPHMIIPAGRSWVYTYNASMPSTKLTSTVTLNSTYHDGSNPYSWDSNWCESTVNLRESSSVTVVSVGVALRKDGLCQWQSWKPVWLCTRS